MFVICIKIFFLIRFYKFNIYSGYSNLRSESIDIEINQIRPDGKYSFEKWNRQGENSENDRIKSIVKQ